MLPICVVWDLGFDMDVPIPSKEYFRIGEVSRIVGVEPYVIRYWETEFKSVRPIRTSSDQRLYRKKDVQELMLIRNLLYADKFTISGARKKLMKMKGETPPAVNEDRNHARLIEIKKGLNEIRELMR